MNPELLDKLIAGQLTPEEFELVSRQYGQETVRRILDGDAKLRNALVSVSDMPPTATLSERIQMLVQKEASVPRWMTLLTRWGLTLGLLLFALAVFSVLPLMFDVGSSASGTVSPLLWTVGCALIVALGAALYLEFGERP